MKIYPTKKVTHVHMNSGVDRNMAYSIQLQILYRQLDFSSEPGFANENLENEPKS